MVFTEIKTSSSPTARSSLESWSGRDRTACTRPSERGESHITSHLSLLTAGTRLTRSLLSSLDLPGGGREGGEEGPATCYGRSSLRLVVMVGADWHQLHFRHDTRLLSVLQLQTRCHLNTPVPSSSLLSPLTSKLSEYNSTTLLMYYNTLCST